MNSKVIGVLMMIAFIAACNETANRSTNSQDSTVTSQPDNTTVSPGIPDSTKNHMQDSAMNH